MAYIYELLPHTADIKMRIAAATQAELFERALVSMFSFMQPKTPLCTLQSNGIYVCTQLSCARAVIVDASEVSLLLVDFLSHALALSEIYHEAYLGLTCEWCDTTQMSGVLKGVPVEGFEGVAIKAVTYNELQVYQDGAGWHAEIVFDI